MLKWASYTLLISFCLWLSLKLLYSCCQLITLSDISERILTTPWDSLLIILILWMKKTCVVVNYPSCKLGLGLGLKLLIQNAVSVSVTQTPFSGYEYSAKRPSGTFLSLPQSLFPSQCKLPAFSLSYLAAMQNAPLPHLPVHLLTTMPTPTAGNLKWEGAPHLALRRTTCTSHRN